MSPQLRQIESDLTPPRRTAWRNVQKAWMTFWTRSCQVESSAVQGGSIGPMVRWQCAARMTSERANYGAGASCVMSGKRYLLHTPHLLKKRAVMDRLQRWVIAVLSCLATWPLAGWAQSPIVGTASGPVQGAIENDIAVFRGAAVCRTAGWPAALARAAAGAGLVGRAAGKLCGRFVFAKARPVA